MPARANWKGYLKLSLVSCPIALYPAISAAERISFRQVNRQTGNRLRHQLVDVGTGAVVEPSDRGRGYELGEQEYLVVEDRELEQAREEARARPFTALPVVPASKPANVQAQVRKARRRSESFAKGHSRRTTSVGGGRIISSHQLAAAEDREQPHHPDRPVHQSGRGGSALPPDTLLRRPAGSDRRGVLRCDPRGDGERGRRRHGSRCAR